MLGSVQKSWLRWEARSKPVAEQAASAQVAGASIARGGWPPLRPPGAGAECASRALGALRATACGPWGEPPDALPQFAQASWCGVLVPEERLVNLARVVGPAIARVLIAGLVALRRVRPLRFARRTLAGLLRLSLGGLAGAIRVGMSGLPSAHTRRRRCAHRCAACRPAALCGDVSRVRPSRDDLRTRRRRDLRRRAYSQMEADGERARITHRVRTGPCCRTL